MKHPHQHCQQTLRMRKTSQWQNWMKEPVMDSRKYLCIHEIPRLAIPPPHQQPIPATPSIQPDQGLPDTPPQQPNQVEVPPQLELMELDVPDDIPDFVDVPEDLVLDFETWAHDVLSYQF